MGDPRSFMSWCVARWRPTSGVLAASVVSGLSIAAGAGCAQEQESLVITRVISWPEDRECFIDPGTDASSIRGFLDVGYGTGYLLPIEVVNQTLSRDPEQSNQGVDTSEVRLRDVIVNLSMPQAPEIIDALRARDPALVEFSAIIPTDSLPGGGSIGLGVEVVTSTAAVALAEELGAFAAGSTLTLGVEVVVRAERSGNTSGNVGLIESRSYNYPVDVCVACSYTCGPCENGVCPDDLPPDPPLAGFICGNAQDGPIYPAACAE